MKKVRAFLGVSISSALRHRLAALQIDLESKLPGVSWVRPESIHLTLKFLGAIDASRVSALTTAIDPVVRPREPFVCRVEGLGTFPEGESPRVLWVGVRDERGELEELRNDLEEQLTSLGFSREDQAFRPHLTLARIRRNHLEFGKMLSEIGRSEVLDDHGELEVERVQLFQSEREESGMLYRALSGIPLSGTSTV
jgi:2'-5' RNA ligase